MFSLFRKEVCSFFNSVMGYLIIGMFLVLNTLFLWIFKGGSNIFNLEYANLNSFFFIAPWILIFIIPAITMRMISEERRIGTLELLLIQPISEYKIIIAKFLAALTLSFIMLLPTVMYIFTIYQLGLPSGNIDIGGVLGGYIGLFMLSSVFCAIGMFSSSFTSNQVVAFMLGVFLCFFMFYGFTALADYDMFGQFDNTLVYLGLNEHYINMGIGVIDTRDVLYFVSVIVLYLSLSRIKIK